MHTYTKTNHSTISGQAIYLQECEVTGLQHYKVKSRSMVLIPVGKGYRNKGYKTPFVPSCRELNPLENERLFAEYPERFSAYITTMIRESMLNNNQTWNERQVLEAL